MEKNKYITNEKYKELLDHFGDISKEELIKRCDEVISTGGTVFVKFICQYCGSRQTSSTPNTLHMRGYTCEECGETSNPQRFGMLVVHGF